MRLRLHSLLAIALAGALVGCSSEKPDYDSMSELELYTRAQQEIKVGNMRSSTIILEAMDKNYPFGPYSQQMQLNLIYAYYKSDNLTLALATVDRFLKLNPTHPNVDWVVYMRGLINMRLDDNMIQNFFNVDRSDRDRGFVMAAFKDFTYLVTRHSNSPYVVDANKRLIYIKNRLAKYQLKVAEYYTDRGAYVAVINRVTRMLSEFPDTEATREGLELMLNAYNKLGLTQEAAKTDLLIQANAKKATQNREKTIQVVAEKTKDQQKETNNSPKEASKEKKIVVAAVPKELDVKKKIEVNKEIDNKVVDRQEIDNKEVKVNQKEEASVRRNSDISSNTEQDVVINKEPSAAEVINQMPENANTDRKETAKVALSRNDDLREDDYPIITADMNRIEENTMKDMEKFLQDLSEFER